MAILDALPGVEVFVSVAGKQLTEYEDKHEAFDGPLATRTVVRYIEATSDSEFTISFKVTPAFKFDCPCISFKVYLDGNISCGTYCSAEEVKKSTWIRTKLGEHTTLPNGDGGLMKFRFSQITTVEDADYERVEADRKKTSCIGQLTIKVYRRGKFRASSNQIRKTVKNDTPTVEIAEKALKGKSISHATGFSPAVPHRYGTDSYASYLDGQDNPISIYQFKYLSKEALRQELIVPRTPSPDPYDALTDGERERLAREKLAELQATRVKLEGKHKRRIKQEDDSNSVAASARPFKKVKLPDGREAIDLTD